MAADGRQKRSFCVEPTPLMAFTDAIGSFNQNFNRMDTETPRRIGKSNINTFVMNDRGPRPNQPICIGEEVRIGIHLAVERLCLIEEHKEMEFPSSLTATERAYIHRLSDDKGLRAKSRGKGIHRFITIYKREGSNLPHSFATFQLARNSRSQIYNLILRYPLSSRERMELQPRVQKMSLLEVTYEFNKTTTGRLNNGVPQVPPVRGTSDLDAFRLTLPIAALEDEIMCSINKNQVMLVAGETGSGKTTQVPQMILDDFCKNKKTCRIFCCQPRRIAALTIAERVAQERGEKIGQTVGYQIRLESRVSPKTILTFCTNGVLLRTVMGGENSLNLVTHIIVDEIHERDRFSDFLLTSLKPLLEKFKNLRLILMSATLNIDLFTKYFNDCPVIQVSGSLFKVEEFFLEDILKFTKYSSKKMDKFRREVGTVKKEQQKQISEWCAQTECTEDKLYSDRSKVVVEITNMAGQLEVAELGPEKENLEPQVAMEMDKLLAEVWLTGDEDIFSQIFHLIMSENVSVDYAHSETSVTPLMIAAGRGFICIAEQLLNLGADVNLRASNDWTAINWAKKFDRMEIVEILEANVEPVEVGTLEDLSLQEALVVTPEDRELLNIYHHSFDDEYVDIDLVISLVDYITISNREGAILVFLPGYDDIVALRDGITEDKRFQNEKFVIFTLHSLMISSDQKRVFKNPPAGVRKIILATNIAETSVTIDDVVFVIDCGKAKEKTFDALSNVSMLKSNWISKSSSHQRRGRAGRCKSGVCYHLFSRIRYTHMQEYQLPEILRYPLQELCLHTKLLAPITCSIAEFLAGCPEPPSFLMTRNAVQILRQIDALDVWEDLTELGHHLTDLPVEPRLGKMLLYSVVLKCLDPILTIVCVLAHKDPFTLPTQPFLKRSANMSRRKFSAGTYSDHMSLLRAFQAWQKARTEGWEKSFCEKNFLSSACMEMVVGMRTQLLGQLRASGFVRARGGGDIRDLNTNSENWAVVKAALCAGMYPNLVYVRRQQGILVSQKESKVRFHASSVLSAAPTTDCLRGSASHSKTVKDLPADWLVYEEMTRYNRLAYIRCSTLVSSAAVTIFAGPAKVSRDVLRPPDLGEPDHVEVPEPIVLGGDESSDSEGEDSDDMKKPTLHIDEWLQFRIDAEAANMIVQLRQKWHCLFLRRMRGPAKPWSPMDESVVRAVINVLTNEEQSLGMQQPAGIGQRPRPMLTKPPTSRTNKSRTERYALDYHKVGNKKFE